MALYRFNWPMWNYKILGNIRLNIYLSQKKITSFRLPWKNKKINIYNNSAQMVPEYHFRLMDKHAAVVLPPSYAL